MAIIAKYPEILKFFSNSKHPQIIKDYLDDAFKSGSETNNRLFNLPVNTFKRYAISEGHYAVEQKFLSKEREKCFFESHIKHIDIQFMIKGEELIEIANNSALVLKEDLSADRDLLIYHDYLLTTKILLREGDVAVFFPYDAHMGTQMNKSQIECVKTVVKMPVSYFQL